MWLCYCAAPVARHRLQLHIIVVSIAASVEGTLLMTFHTSGNKIANARPKQRLVVVHSGCCRAGSCAGGLALGQQELVRAVLQHLPAPGGGGEGGTAARTDVGLWSGMAQHSGHAQNALPSSPMHAPACTLPLHSTCRARRRPRPPSYQCCRGPPPRPSSQLSLPTHCPPRTARQVRPRSPPCRCHPCSGCWRVGPAGRRERC